METQLILIGLTAGMTLIIWWLLTDNDKKSCVKSQSRDSASTVHPARLWRPIQKPWRMSTTHNSGSPAT